MKGIWGGLGQRLVFNGIFNCFLWGIYDSLKVAMGLETTGEGSKKLWLIILLNLS